jgi:hypothetical protein
MSLSSAIKSKAAPRMIKDTRRYAKHVGEIMVTYLKNKLSKHHVVGTGREATNRSKPGEYPHLETGSLEASIDYNVKKIGNRIRLIFGALKPVFLGGREISPTLYGRWLVRFHHRKLAKDAYQDARASGALRKALNRRRVAYRAGRLGYTADTRRDADVPQKPE